MEDDLPQKYAKLQEEVSELKETLNFCRDTAAIAFLRSAYTGKSNLSLNESLESFEKLTDIFSAAKVRHKVMAAPEKPYRFDITFGPDVAYEDLYSIARVARIYGCQSLFYVEDAKNKIHVGSYITYSGVNNAQTVASGCPFDAINWTENTTTHEIITFAFGHIKFLPKIKFREESDFQDRYANDEDNDNGDRENFDALTDGQEGDINNFDGDWDALDDRLGR